MNFHNISFPLPLAFGASGGPARRTEITTLASGAEYRNTPHAHARRRYDAGAGITSLDDLHTLTAFFEARRGQLHSFRFRDPVDHKSCPPGADISAADQVIGQGDGSTADFQLAKTYADMAGDYVRPITKPVATSVMVAVDDQSAIVSVDELTGMISFAIPPASGAVITAGFEFDVPVRFDTDRLTLALEAFGAGQAAHIPLIEVLGHA